MSTKRILGITLFGLLFIVAVIGVMLLTLFLRRESDTIELPEIPTPTETPSIIEPDALDRVVVTTETIQAIVSSLSRPEKYSRDVLIKSYWEEDNNTEYKHAEYKVSVSVMYGITSLSTLPQVGIEKRIIITPNKLYIWYSGDTVPYTGDLASSGDSYRTADEWQMLVTYEDIVALNKDNIIDAGRVEYDDKDCVYAVYRSPLLNYTRTFYVSLESGLVIYAKEDDETSNTVYEMTASECKEDDVDEAAFTLPNGINLVES